MTSKLVVAVSVIMILVILTPQKSLSDACNRPKKFVNSEILQEYIACVKAITSARYGKRSYSSNPLIDVLVPSLYRDYNQPKEDLSDLYAFLKKYDRNN